MTERTERLAEYAMIGAIVIIAALAVSMAIGRAGESQAATMRAQCDVMLLASAIIEADRLYCPGAADFGHDESTLALCRLARGRTPEQVQQLPQCREDLP